MTIEDGSVDKPVQRADQTVLEEIAHCVRDGSFGTKIAIALFRILGQSSEHRLAN